jgi:predicted RNA binding protein YcfA (HicA-like mRNA interferase family)
MGEKNFNKRQCIRALVALGFYLDNKRRGQHDKFAVPVDLAAKIVWPNPKCIMVPRHNTLHCQEAILQELRKMGGDDLVRRFIAEL